jgi:hypothetical protein
MTTKTRIYRITSLVDGKEHLVRAANVVQARSHVAKAVFETAVATQDDLVRLLPAGVKVELVGAEE